MYKFLQLCFPLLLIASMLFFSKCDFLEEAKPANVVLLLIDDMGHGDIAAHGNPVLKTPNFDQLHRGDTSWKALGKTICSFQS